MVASHLTVNSIQQLNYVAVHLYGNRSQMTSKCGITKKCHTRLSQGCYWMLSPHFDIFWDLSWTVSQQHGIYLFYIIKSIYIVYGVNNSFPCTRLFSCFPFKLQSRSIWTELSKTFLFLQGKNMILLVQKNELLTIFFLEFGHKKKIIFSTFAAQTHVDYERVILSSKE